LNSKHPFFEKLKSTRGATDRKDVRLLLAAYLSDLIDIFESHGWDWSYHAFREWSGWSLEYGSDRQDTEPASSPTDRQWLLCDWFARNQKPRW
jgi:hypothetical protein